MITRQATPRIRGFSTGSMAITAVTVAKGCDNVLRYTVNDASMQLLYVPVPSHQRGRAKAFVDGIIDLAVEAAGIYESFSAIHSQVLGFPLGRWASMAGLGRRADYGKHRRC